MTTDLLLIVLGPLIPLLTFVFIKNLLAWQRDFDAAQRDAAQRDAVDQWYRDWSFWFTTVEEEDSLTVRRTAGQMLQYLQGRRTDES